MSRIRQNSYLFRHCLEKSQLSAKKRSWNKALGWAAITGRMGWKAHPGFYASRELEALLLEVGRNIQDVYNVSAGSTGGGRRKWLHAMTAAHGTGGHTRFVERWIRRHLEINDDVHSIILLEQRNDPVPSWLQEAATLSGGTIFQLDSSTSFVDRALKLRSVARGTADVVVQHVHPYDPIPTVAFAVNDLPPVLYLNHADHLYWTGLSAADKIIDFRDNGRQLTRQRRTKNSSDYLPIPLLDRLPGGLGVSRERLGLPQDKVILLSIGGGYKFEPFGELNFLRMGKTLCQRHENILFLTIGPSPKREQWRQAFEETGGRFRALGSLPQIEDYYNACDIYLESFPLGSLTASLDAALYGKPIVKSPSPILPVLSLDDHYDGLENSCDSVEAYLDYVSRLVNDPGLRGDAGARQRSSVADLHAGEGWNRCLSEIIATIPSSHKPRLPSVEDLGVSDSQDLIWTELQATFGPTAHRVFRGSMRQMKRHLSPISMAQNRVFSYAYQFYSNFHYRTGCP